MSPRTMFLRPQCLRVVPVRSAVASLALRACSSAAPKNPRGSNQDVLPHASEEAAATAKITSETPPDIEQGTSISEMIQRDTEALKNAPSVLKKELKGTAVPGSKREYSTYVDPRDNDRADDVDFNAEFDAAAMHGTDNEPVQADAVSINLEATIPEGAKYPLPTLPLPATSVMKKRYPPVVEQVTNLIMRHGKKATAQSVMTEVLAILRTKSAPKPSLRANIIPTAPPLASLPSDPIAYLQTAIDSVGPLMTIKSIKGSGGFRESVPSPLRLRQRRRKAITWIIEAADKKKARMSLAERLADEIVAVVEGRSTAWDKRQQVHKTAVASRANVKVKVM